MIKNFLRTKACLLMAGFVLLSCSQEDSITNEPADFDSVDLVQLRDELPAITGASKAIPGQYIVVYNREITGDLGSTNSRYAQSQQGVIGLTQEILGNTRNASNNIIHVYSKSVLGVTLRLSEEQVSLFRNDQRVMILEQDRIVQFAPPCGTPNGPPCDGDGGGGGGDTGGSQSTPWGITRVNGVNNYTGSNAAWILDSGIDLDHPDLNVDESRAFNAFSSGQDGRSANDLNGHGTHVAGTIAALNNDIGVVGVAPGAAVIPVKVLDRRGSGSYSGVIAGVDHVAANASNGDVANMSLGGPASAALDNAIASAAQSGVKFALAAGNEGQDANNVSPARVNGSNIYTISAMSQGDNWASFSNYGNPPVDYCAPGVAIESTWKNGGYNTISGTSMASPHAAGVLLLGNASSDGVVNNDPDGNSDSIIVH